MARYSASLVRTSAALHDIAGLPVVGVQDVDSAKTEHNEDASDLDTKGDPAE